MTSKKHRMIVYGVAAQLLLIALVCYAAFPVKAPDEPVRLMYWTKAGKVLFDHKTHTAETGYGLSCFDCHHHHGYETPEEMLDDRADEKKPIQACGACHLAKPVEGKHPENCFDCHEESDLEDSEYPKHSEALHDQCTECHLSFGTGPLYQNSLSEEEIDQLKTEPNEWVDCNKCHVL